MRRRDDDLTEKSVQSLALVVLTADQCDALAVLFQSYEGESIIGFGREGTK